jgi:hypothetical protein
MNRQQSEECSSMTNMKGVNATGGIRLTATESILADMWSDLIGVSTVSSTDDFFQLGGTSLTAIKLLQRVERKFGPDVLAPETLYEDARLHSIAEAIDGAV